MSASITRLSVQALSSTPDEFKRALFNGLKEHGFVILRDHDITQSRLELAYGFLRALFSQPLAQKLAYDSGRGGARGYTAFGRENAAGNPVADLKEFWQIGPEIDSGSSCSDVTPANVWPDGLPGFKECFMTLFTQLEALGKTMLSALTGQLGLQPGFFDDLVTDGNSVLRLLHYPALEDTGGLGKAMRSAPHSDINLLTLLVGATDSGLELLDRQGNWLPVETLDDEIVLDTGDMMSRLTNDILPSTVHRVVNPNDAGGSRYSMPFFLHPHSDASLACLSQCVGTEGARYPPIKAGEFLQQRLEEIGLGRY